MGPSRSAQPARQLRGQPSTPSRTAPSRVLGSRPPHPVGTSSGGCCPWGLGAHSPKGQPAAWGLPQDLGASAKWLHFSHLHFLCGVKQLPERFQGPSPASPCRWGLRGQQAWKGLRRPASPKHLSLSTSAPPFCRIRPLRLR